MKVVQHCFGTGGSGGPVVALERLQNASSMNFGFIRQLEPAGGISLRLLLRFVREISALEPDLVHVRGLGNEGFHAALAARLAGVRNVLVSVHGTQRDLLASRWRIRRWIVVNVLERATLMLASHVATVCHSAAAREFLLPYRQKLAAVVPNGVPIPPEQDDVVRAAVRRELCVPQHRILALCVSRITPEKGYSVLADALERMNNAALDIEFIVVGGGEGQERLIRRFNGPGAPSVRFLGHKADVQRYYRGSDLFILPSFHENLSNSLLEAMSFGLPVIASAVGGNVEVLNRGGGLLVPPGDAQGLGDAISRVARNPVELNLLAQQARANVASNYSVSTMVDGWEELYTRILGAVS